MLQYDNEFDPFAPGADPNAPGMYAPPGVGPQTPDHWQPPPQWNWMQPAQSEAFNPFGAPQGGSGGGGGGSPEEDAANGLTGGYYGANGQWVRGEPRSSGGGGGGGQGAGGVMPQWAQPDYPGYRSAGAFAPRRDTFTFDAFAPSSWSDAESEPGYGASRDQLRKQIEAGAAHRGMLRSGMTIGDLYTNLDSLGQQNFAQFDDRRFRNWSGNLTANRNKFLDEYGIDKDQYTFRASDVDRENNFAFNVADRKAADSLARWQEQVRSLTQLGRPT